MKALVVKVKQIANYDETKKPVNGKVIVKPAS